MNASWTLIKTEGPTPGKRYGHSMNYLKPYIVIFGGYAGCEPVNDTWVLMIEQIPFKWQKIDFKNELPLPRVYHTCSLCSTGKAAGMLVLFGGRAKDQNTLSDTWGLRKHRDGSWDWIKAPYSGDVMPTPRFQHSSTFIGSINIIAGGRGGDVGDPFPIDAYDTNSSTWKKIIPLPRFRHTAWIVDNGLCVFGGFENSMPTKPVNNMMCLDLSGYVPKAELENTETTGGVLKIKSDSDSQVIAKKENQPHLLAETKIISNSMKDLGKQSEREKNTVDKIIAKELEKEVKSNRSRGGKEDPRSKSLDDRRIFKMSPRVLVAMSYGPEVPPSLQRMVKSLSVSNLQEESKRLVPTNRVVFGPTVDEITEIDHKKESIAQMFINHLLRPKDWSVNQLDRQFIFKKEDILLLTHECSAIVKNQPSVLKVKVPVKVFGDIHGQYQDLMRFFDLWRGPTESAQGGDIESYDYLFLGDYVDRGAHSLETICLLMALKVKYPNQIHLLRGNHEDGAINRVFGFAEECEERLDDDIDDSYSVFKAINSFFEWLPLAGVIEDRILCLHGGIGSTLKTISDLEKLQRPVQVVHEVENIFQQLLIDVLWSDPTDNDQEMGIQNDAARDPNGTGYIVRYGPDRVEEFLKKNDLMMIIRGHECVMDGIERFAKGQLITVFSATDYCGKHKNAGAALFVQKNYEIVPKLIFPLDTSKQSSWIETDKRPQTPPGWKSNSNDQSFG